MHCQNNTIRNLAIQKLEVPFPKKKRHIDQHIKEVSKKYHEKYIHSETLI